MVELAVRPASGCRYDVVSLGEVMLRLDPGEGRIRTARSFQAWEGGGEYNVARGLVSTFGLRGAVVTALVDNEVGRLVEGLVRAGGVGTELVRWLPHDGFGREARNGLNFTERGFGVRGALGVYDRGHTAVSRLAPGDVDWDHLFGEVGVRWLHTGGVAAGLSPTMTATVVEAVEAARRHGTVVSYDVNYRPGQWRGVGGAEAATEVNRAVAPHVDVLLGLGFDIDDARPDPGDLEGHRAAMERTAAAFPGLRVIATTTRTVLSASVNGWGALAWSPQDGLVRTAAHGSLEIMDRVGGGDAFASGLVHGLLAGESLQDALGYGAAHGALAMTTPGDTSMATAAEVLALAAGAGAAADR